MEQFKEFTTYKSMNFSFFLINKLFLSIFIWVQIFKKVKCKKYLFLNSSFKRIKMEKIFIIIILELLNQRIFLSENLWWILAMQTNKYLFSSDSPIINASWDEKLLFLSPLLFSLPIENLWVWWGVWTDLILPYIFYKYYFF